MALNDESNNQDFSTLVDTYYQALYRFGYSLTKNEHEASDLTQQTFVIYAEKGSTIKDRSKVKSWLFTSLYREFLRIRRRSAKSVTQEPEILELETPPVESNAVESMHAKEALAALEKVDEVYRAPLTLFYLKELSYKEISSILEIPIGTVMSRLSRGKTQLRNLLQDIPAISPSH